MNAKSDEPIGSENARPEPRSESSREARRFTDAFGVVIGAKWYAAGKTFEQASSLYRARLLAENDQLRAATAELLSRQ